MPVDIESQVLFVISELLMSVLIVNDCSYIIKRLEKQFSSLQRKLLSEMKSNTPETLLDSMPQLPVALQGEYRKFLFENLKTLEKADSIREIFRHLNLHFTFIDCRLQGHIIEDFGSNRLKKKTCQPMLRQYRCSLMKQQSSS